MSCWLQSLSPEILARSRCSIADSDVGLPAASADEFEALDLALKAA
jgi:hypothetical protein